MVQGVPVGELGVVELVDSLATIHVRWDCGRRFDVTADVPDMIRVAPGPGSDG